MIAGDSQSNKHIYYSWWNFVFRKLRFSFFISQYVLRSFTKDGFNVVEFVNTVYLILRHCLLNGIHCTLMLYTFLLLVHIVYQMCSKLYITRVYHCRFK